MLDELNHTRPDHIITIEDPIEFIFTPDKAIITQREI
jgi:twitching motility protein PilT